MSQILIVELYFVLFLFLLFRKNLLLGRYTLARYMYSKVDIQLGTRAVRYTLYIQLGTYTTWCIYSRRIHLSTDTARHTYN